VIESIRVLVDAGATLESAIRASAVLDRGGSVTEARALIELAPEPLKLDAELLAAAIARAASLELVRSFPK
jgi:hypothetical protein